MNIPTYDDASLIRVDEDEETDDDRNEHIRVQSVYDVEPEEALQVNELDDDIKIQDPRIARDLMAARLFYLSLDIEILYQQSESKMKHSLERQSMRLQSRSHNDFTGYTPERHKDYFIPLMLVDAAASFPKQFRRPKLEYHFAFYVTEINTESSCFLVKAQALCWENNLNQKHICFVNFISLINNPNTISKPRSQARREYSASELPGKAVFAQCTSRDETVTYSNYDEARLAHPEPFPFLRKESRIKDQNFNVVLCTYVFRIYIPPGSSFRLIKKEHFILKKIFPLSHGHLPTVKALSTLSYQGDYLSKIIQPTRLSFINNFESFGIHVDLNLNLCQEQYIYGFIRMHLEEEFKILLLQGPPGTGKTFTIIAAIKVLIMNILKNKDFSKLLKNFRILVCAHSNGATDQLAKRLMKLKHELQEESNFSLNVVRVGNPDAVHADVRPIYLQTLKKNKMLELSRDLKTEITGGEIEESILNASHIIVSTLSSATAGKMSRMTNRITTLVIDEGSQAAEPSTIQALSLMPKYLCIIGDHQQLAPTIMSRFTQELNKSLFERLWICQKENELETLTLEQQYRMNPEICAFPSENFYNSKLLPANNEVGLSQIGLKPFYVFDLKDSMEEEKGKSKFNNSEIEVIFNLLHSIYKRINSRIEDGILPTDSVVSIGVLSFYDAQRERLKLQLDADQVLKKAKFLDIQVGNVDGFQGQEKDVILLSCVRAISKADLEKMSCRMFSSKHVDEDDPMKKYPDYGTPDYKDIQKRLGFIRNQRRINVAASRAKFAFYTVMHGDSLRYLHVWANFIDYAWSIARFVSISSHQTTNFDHFLYDL